VRASLVAPNVLMTGLRGDLLGAGGLEAAAVGFAGIHRTPDHERLLLRDWASVPSDEYLEQLSYHLEVSPLFWARAAKRARFTGEALVVTHSHPGDADVPRFSPSDDAGGRRLVPKLHARAPGPVGELVVSPGGVNARYMRHGGSPVQMRVVTELHESLTVSDSTWVAD
jgi:hypothetical protein